MGCELTPVDGLKRIGTLLGAIGAMLGPMIASAGAQPVGHAQRELDEVKKAIEWAVDWEPPVRRPRVRVYNEAPDVASYHVRRAVIPPNQPLDVVVDVRASAQIAGLALSVGGDSLAATAYIRIEGSGGGISYTFLSGSTLGEIAGAFGAATWFTRVQPTLTSGAVMLHGGWFGNDSFVSVRMLAPSIQGPGAGIYRFMPNNMYEIDWWSRVPLYSAAALNGVTDWGQDLQAEINGMPAVGQGLSLRLDTPALNIDMELTPYVNPWPPHVLSLGSFRAFTIIAE